MTDNNVTGSEMTAPRAAMAAVTVRPEKRSRMMTSFAVQLSDCSEIPPWTHIGPLSGLVLVYRGSVCREKMVLRGVPAPCPLARTRANRSGGRELHHFKRGTPHDGVGIAQCLADLEVIVALAHDQLHRLAGGHERCSEVARLALKLWRLQSAVGKNERRVNPVDMALGGQRLLHFIGEFDVIAALGKSHRLEVVHAAAEHGAFEDIAREPLLLPFRDDDAAGEMAAGRPAAQVGLVGIGAKTRSVPIDEGNRAPALLDHRKEVAAGLDDIVEID